MGFRLASLRRTNVVMAPVCTYIIFVKDFPILIEYHRIERVVISAGDHFRKCSKQFQLMYVIVFCIFANKKTVRHANGDLFVGLRVYFRADYVLNKSNSDFSCLFAYCFVARCCIMSESDSMENKAEMGLQKIDMPNFDTSLNMKDKRCTPAVDILSNLEKEMCRNGGNFQQDCEEFLKMMTSTNEVEKAVPSVPFLTNGQAFPETNEIPRLESDLLGHVGAIEVDSVAATPAPTTVSYTDVSEENRKRCLQMERRIDRLTRRLKLKQSKLYGLHTSEQISGLLDFCRCKFVDRQQSTDSYSDVTMDAYVKRLKRCSDQSCVPLNDDRFNHYFGFGSRESKNVRSCVLSVAPNFDAYVYDHIEKIAGELHTQARAIAHDFDSDVTASSSGCDSLDEEYPQTTSEIPEDRIKKIPLNKRAIWRWLRNRASIAYRLSWLQSRMSALEYKIHHYTEIYKKLRCAKGQVLLYKESERSTLTNGPSTRTLTPTSNPVPTTPVKENVSLVVLNGFHGSLSTATSTSPSKTPDTMTVDGGSVSCGESDETCSRTCPLSKAKFKKRNLIRLDASMQVNGGGISNSCPKYSSVRCDCVPPLSCILCAARGPGVDLSYQHIYSNLLPVQSKIALLEPTYHSVLSFPSDVSVSTHLSACLNSEDVLSVCEKSIESRTAATTTNPATAIKRFYSNYKTTEEIRRTNLESGNDFKRRKKYMKRQPNNSQNIAFGRSQLSKQRHLKLDKALSLRKRRRKRLLCKRYKAKNNGLDESPDEGLYYKKEKEEVYSSQPSSPHSSHSSTVKDPLRRKRGQSYDIDNFIIPPNSTPTAVVSKPQYKEILIPTWKVIHERAIASDEISTEAVSEYMLEDVSDDTVVKYHEMMEHNEMKKFRTNSIRHGSRSRKRTDSYPETSETNTPERVPSPPVSTNSESNDAISSSVTAALGTSMMTVTTSSNQNNTNNRSKLSALGKRNNSLDCDTPSVTENISTEVAPYERRIFPLSDDEYKELLASLLNTKMEDGQTEIEQEIDSKQNEIVTNKVDSPLSESMDSVLEDPNDPDWMVNHEDEKGFPETPRK